MSQLLADKPAGWYSVYWNGETVESIRSESVSSISSELQETLMRSVLVENAAKFNFDYTAMEEEMIKTAAYYKWQNAGYPDDMEKHFWEEAKTEIKRII